MQQGVILINPFEVLAGEEERFLKTWHQAAEHLRKVPGFRSTRLHRSLDPNAKFQFINVAEWESPEAFHAAMGLEEFLKVREAGPFTAYPTLYQVVSE